MQVRAEDNVIDLSLHSSPCELQFACSEWNVNFDTIFHQCGGVKMSIIVGDEFGNSLHAV